MQVDTIEKDNGGRFFPSRPTLGQYALWIASVALIYFTAARLGLSLVLQPEGIAPVWLPGGIFLSAFLLTRRKARPLLAAVLCATDFTAEMLAGTPFFVSAVYALALTGDAVLSSWLLVRFLGEPIAFRKTREVVGFLAFAVILSNSLAALPAAGVSGLIEGTSFWDSFREWVVSDGIGNLLLTPFILSWASLSKTGLDAWHTKRVLEGVALFVPMTLLNFFSFGYLPTSGLFSLLLPYTTLPFLLWVALRFGIRGVTSALIILTAIIIHFAVADRLPHFSFYGSPLNDVIVVQLYLAIMAIPSLLLGVVVTERRQAEASVRESEARLNKAEEIAHVGSWELDFSTDCLTWSDEVYRIFGLSPQGFGATYQAFLEAVHPDDRAAVNTAYSESLQEGRDVYEIEHRIVRKSTGEIRHVREKCEHVRNATRRVIRSVGIVHDITEHKRAEETLRERNRYIETILENSPIGFAVNTIHDGKGVFVCGRFEDIYGVPRGSVHTVDEYFEKVYLDPVFREEIRARIMADMASGNATRMRWEDLPITTAAGEKRFVTAINIPLLDQNVMVSTVQDVTARHQAEEALRESEERFRTLIEQAGDGVELQDAEGRFLDVNSTTCRQLGYSREELLRMAVFDVDPLVSRERYAATFQSLVNKPPVLFESVHRRKDGTTFPVEITTSVIRLGSVFRAVTLVRDITERKRQEEERKKLQEQLVQAQKMESVGRLAGGVAHDFNNMLGVILGHVELALSDHACNLPLDERLKQIQTAARRSADLTRQLLAFARKQTVKPKVLDLNDAVGGMLKMLRRLIGEDIDLAWMPGADLWPVKIDPAQIDQILANLCVNARDAITGVGKVTIETAKMMTCDEAYCTDHPDMLHGEYVMLAVSDDGCGMDKNTLDHVFEPFFTTKDVGHGTGLGLATVYGIVRQNEGFINVYSEPGRGTTFKIYLPKFEAEAVEEIGVKKESEPRGGTETILVVEDEKMFLDLSTNILASLGYTVLATQIPSEALAVATRHKGPIHLLITDVVMPEMNGRVLSERLATLRPETKILFTSGYTANTIAHHGVLEEGVQFLQKPFSIKDLAAKVREILDWK